MSQSKAPIVVCGPARSGTTAMQAMFNSHPDVLIAREVPLPNMPSLKPLIAETERQHAREWTEERKLEVVRSLWFATSRPMPPKPAASRWGMKTTWSELDADFWTSLVDPVYVYAVRRGDRVFQSHIRLGWNFGSPEKLIQRYKDSVRAFEKLRSEGLACLVQLDLAESREARYRMAKETFEFVGVEVEEDHLRNLAALELRVNQPTSEPGEEPELPDEWNELLEADGEYQDVIASLGYR